MSAVPADPLDHFFLFFRDSSNFAAALIRAICTSSSAPLDTVSQTSFGLAGHIGRRIERERIGRNLGDLGLLHSEGRVATEQPARNKLSESRLEA